MKLEDVLMMDTRVVDEARVSAAVKSAHMRALKVRLSRKQICGFFSPQGWRVNALANCPLRSGAWVEEGTKREKRDAYGADQEFDDSIRGR